MTTLVSLNFSDTALKRLKSPEFRGKFWPEDAADESCALLSVGNAEGRIYWLVDAEAKQVKGTKFLAYGNPSSTPILDGFCELSVGKTLGEACSIANAEIQSTLGLEKDHNWDDDLFEFLNDLKSQITSRADLLKTEIRTEAQDKVYKRKELHEMDERDQKWLPLSAPAKIRKLGQHIEHCLKSRTKYRKEDVEVYNVIRDLEVKVAFSQNVEDQERATLLQFLSEDLKAHCHPDLEIDLVD